MLPDIKIRATADVEDAIDGLDRLEDQYRETGEEAARSRKKTDQFDRGLGNTARASTSFSRGIQNASFQLGDFATQVGAGTSASIALGQQLPQLLGGFGILGAVLGAVVAVGVPLARVLSEMSSEGGDLGRVLGVLEPTADGVADAFRQVAQMGAMVANVIVKNLDRILITAALVATFFAGKWVASFVAAQIATMSLAGALLVLRTAIAGTGVGVLIIIAGELVFQFFRLVEAAGGVSKALRLIFQAGKEAFHNLLDVAAGLSAYMQGVGKSIQAAFVGAFANIAERWDTLVNGMAEAWNTVAGSLGLGTIDTSSIGEDLRGRQQGLQNEASNLFSLGSELMDTAIPSLERIHELLASMRDERLTISDILGGGGENESGRTQLEEDAERQVNALKLLRNQGRATWQALGTFVQQFAGKSRAAAIAAIAISKGLAIAQAIQNTAVAYTAALKYDPTGAMSARIAALGKIQVGLIAATGLAQAAASGGGGGGGGSVGRGGGGSAASAGGAGGTVSPPRQNISISLQGDSFSREGVESLVTSVVERLQGDLDRGGQIAGGRVVFQ